MSTHITDSRNERRNIIADSMDIKRIINKYYNQLYAHKSDNLDKMDKLFKKHNLKKKTHARRNI